MSHDRGCYCGRERWEYDSCSEPQCYKKKLSYVNQTPKEYYKIHYILKNGVFLFDGVRKRKNVPFNQTHR